MTEKVQYDLILKNGTVVLPSATTQVDIGIKDEKIHTIGNLSECDTDCCTDSIIECKGLHVLSLIHISEPTRPY